MSYTPQEWRNWRIGGTPASAERLAHMESGIKEASDRLDEVAVDSRWADTRTPKTHAASHASGGSDPVTPAAIGALDQAAADARYAQTTDARLSNARTPTAHKASHAAGGADALSPADIGALDQAAGDARYPRKGDLVVNVKDYGATGDGSTDDTTSFIAAIAAIKAMPQATRRPLYCPAGRYRLTGTLLIDFRNFQLIGDGSQVSILAKNGTGELLSFGTFSSNQGATGATAYNGPSQDYRIEDIAFESGAAMSDVNEGARPGTGVLDAGCGGGVLRDVRFTGFKYGFAGAYGVDFQTFERCSFTHNDVGVYMGPGSQQYVIRDGNFYWNREGVVLEGACQGKIDSCWFVLNSFAEITVEANVPSRMGIASGGPQQNHYGLDIVDCWHETNAGNLGRIAPRSILIQGTPPASSQVIRGIRVINPYIIAGGTPSPDEGFLEISCATTDGIYLEGLAVNGGRYKYAVRYTGAAAAGVGNVTIRDLRQTDGYTGLVPFNVDFAGAKYVSRPGDHIEGSTAAGATLTLRNRNPDESKDARTRITQTNASTLQFSFYDKDSGTWLMRFEVDTQNRRLIWAESTFGRVAANVVGTSDGTALRTGRGPTASRPSAVTAGDGAWFYDTDIDRPIWSDGAVWRVAVDDSDARLSNARTPTAHKASHAAGGADVLSPADIGAVAKSGDTMTGALTLSGVPTANNHAAHKAYVDSQDGARLALTGGTLTGDLVLPSFSSIKVEAQTNRSFSNNEITILNQTPFGAMWHDLLAFNRHFGAPAYETSADGITFTAATRDDRLFALKETQNVPVLNGTTTIAARWTWSGSQVQWSGVNWLVIGHAYVADVATKTVTVETSIDNVNWTVRYTASGTWNQQPVWYFVNSWGGDTQVRVTITRTSGGGIQLTSIRMLTSRWGSQGSGRENEFPYTWDETGRMGIKAPPDPSAGLTVGASIKLIGGTVYNLAAPVNGGDAATKAYADTKAPARPNPPAGRYLFTASPQGAATNNTLANSMLRLIPWLVDKAMTIDRIGADIAAVGEAGSTLRLGIYADNGSAYPGSLIVDAGQVAGDSATVQELTIASVTLQPGLYWVGGAVQNAPTTQPTVRVVSSWTPPIQMATGTTLPIANQAQIGYSQGSVAGALPASFTTSLSMVSSAPRLFVRTA